MNSEEHLEGEPRKESQKEPQADRPAGQEAGNVPEPVEEVGGSEDSGVVPSEALPPEGGTGDAPVVEEADDDDAVGAGGPPFEKPLRFTRDEISALMDELKLARREKDEYQDDMRRMKAELENSRKHSDPSRARQGDQQTIPLEELRTRGPSENGTETADRDVVGGPIQLHTQPYDPSRHRELMRGALAISLVVILGLIVFMSFLMIWPSRNVSPPQASVAQQIASRQPADQPFMVQNQQQDQQGTTAPPSQNAPQGTATPAQESPLQDLLTLIFTPIIGLVGAVTGFYYGGESARTRAGA